MPDFAVNTAFGGKDKGINAAWKRMTKNAKLFGNTSKSAFDKASRSGKRFQGVTSGILRAGAVSRGLGLMSRGVGEVVSQFVQFDDAIIGAAARFKDIGPGAENFNEQLKLLKARARDAGATTEFTATQAAESLDFLARAGFKSAEAMGALDTMINLATASGEDFAQVADFSSDLLGAFGLNTEDTTQKLKNLTRLNDVLVKSANSANVTIESQFETMKIAAPIFAIFGDNLEQVASLTAAMGNAGIKGSQGATALKNAILRLAAPTPKVMDGMAQLGLTMDDIQTIGKDGKKNMKPMTEILKTMGPLLNKLGTKDQAQVLDAIFGKRAIAAVGNLTGVIDNVIKFEAVLKNADGTAKKTAETMRKSLGNRLKALQSAAIETGFKFLEAFQGQGTDAITSLTDAIRGFDVTPIVNGLKFVIISVKGIVAVLSFLSPILKIVAVGFAINFLTMKGIAALNFASTMFGYAKAFISAGRAVGFMNLLLSVNPFILIAAAIAAVIVGVIRLISIWDDLVATFKKDGFFAALAKFFGIGGDAEITAPEAPNKSEVNARAQVSGDVNVNFSNAPKGTTAETKSRTPGVDMSVMGMNP